MNLDEQSLVYRRKRNSGLKLMCPKEQCIYLIWIAKRKRDIESIGYNMH
jgi:hypothetical protein